MDKRSIGLISGISCYISWGILGIFWALLRSVPSIDVLAYRFLFSLVFMIAILSIQRNWQAFFQVVRELFQSGKLLFVILSSACIAINWGTYIYMVGHGQATEASLGYYIMPLLNVLVAVVFFKETFSRATLLAVILATSGVGIFAFQTGSIPLNTFIMALSFCFYGVIKKQVSLPASFSLTLETMISIPFAVLYLAMGSSTSFFSFQPMIIGLLILSGAITAVPLLLFTVAAKNLDFLTLSFIQYVNPTIQLLLAVFWFHESFDRMKFLVFGLIWVGVIVFAIGSVKDHRRIVSKK